MPLPVKLRDVVMEMEMQSDEHRAYINRQTGELVTVSDEERRAVERHQNLADDEDLDDDGETEDSEDSDWDDLPAWQREGMPKVQEVLESDDYLVLPDQFAIHEWSIMEQFSESVDDDRWRDELLTAIHGSGAFRYFKDTIHRLGIQKDWYAFRDEALSEIARDFLEAHEIPFVDDAEGDSA